MRIGSDFPKIEFELFGLDLLEPNAVIGDTIILVMALYFAHKIANIKRKTSFNNLWAWFYLFFGFSFFIGGLGHALFNYTGIPGKYPSWYLGMISSYFLERAMISIYPVISLRKLFNQLALIKLVLALIAATMVFNFVDLSEDPSIGLRVPTINSIIGLIFSLAVLGLYYTRKIHPEFRYLFISFLLLIPTVFVQSMKIGFYPWFDRNDISHVLLLISMILYWKSIKAYSADNG